METARYTRTAIALHWLIAIGVIANIALAWTWPYLADDSVRPVIDTHKSIGVTVLGLAIMRLLWRYGHRPPPLPSGSRPCVADHSSGSRLSTCRAKRLSGTNHMTATTT